MSLPRLRRSRTPLVLALLATALSGCAPRSDPLAGSSPSATCREVSPAAVTPASVSAHLVPGLAFDTQTDETLQVHVTTPVLPNMTVLNQRLRSDAARDLQSYRSQRAGETGGELNGTWSLLGVSPHSVGVLSTEERTAGAVTRYDVRTVWYDPSTRRLVPTADLLDAAGWTELGSRLSHDLCVSADQRDAVGAAWSEPGRPRVSVAFSSDGRLIALVTPAVPGRKPTVAALPSANVARLLTATGRDAQAAASDPRSLPPQPVPVTRTVGPPVPQNKPTTKVAEKPPVPKPTSKSTAKPQRSVDCRRLRCVALTFDDGPGPYTASLLETLRAEHAPATFFMVGEHVDAFPHLAHQVSAAGFEIGNHSYTHPDLTRMSRARATSQISRTSLAIQHATGHAPTLLRPPYGARNKRVDKIAARSGLSEVLWDVDTLDWKHRRVKSVQKRALAGVHPGSIVLLHDIHPKTVEAVPGLISALRERGYTLVTVSQVIGTPKPGLRYFSGE